MYGLLLALLIGNGHPYDTSGAVSSIVAPIPGSDVAPTQASIYAANAYPQATVNTSGANILLDPGDGRRFVTVTNVAISELDTITLTINGTAVTRTAKNPGPAGVNEFLCITDVGTCATALAAAYAGVTGVTATVVGAVVYFELTAGSTYSLVPTVSDAGGGGAFAAVTSGNDGQVLLGNRGTQTLPAIAAADDPDTGIHFPSANVMRLGAGGIQKLSIESQIEAYSALDMNSFSLFGVSGFEIPSADLAVGSCVVNRISYDTGGATVEWCHCRVANAWFCLPSGTVNGPAD